MELIDRYLQVVQFWLPKKQKQDIVGELSEDIRSQAEQREAELGRKLNEAEAADLLKQRGRPLLVANIVGSAVNLFRRYWTMEAAIFRLLFDGTGSVLFCWLTKSSIVSAISVVNVAPEKTMQIAHATNWWAAEMFPLAVVVCVALAVADAHRIVRGRTRGCHSVALNTASGAC